MDVGIIEAIGKLWLLALVIFLLIFSLIFRKQIGSLLERLNKFQFKTGRTQVSMSQETKEELKPELSEGSIASEEKQTLAEDQKLIELEPTTSDEWGNKMVDAFFKRDIKQVDEAFKKMQEFESQASKKLQNEAFYYWVHYELGDTSALQNLQNMTKQEDLDKVVLRRANWFTGHCYRRVDDFEKAANAYEAAAQLSETELDRAKAIVENAICLFKINKRQEALTKLMDQTKIATEPDTLSTIYEGLASIYELTKEPELRAIALEKALEIKPNDTQLLFKAAYSYAEKKLSDLALSHYKTLLEFKPDDAATLNNIAILYSNLGMPMRSIELFKKAVELNHTLAAANLAEHFLDAGFKEEASKILDKAKEQKDFHPNVGRAISNVSNKEAAESKTEESSIDAAREQQRFLLIFAGAYFKGEPDCPQFSGMWKLSDDSEMNITQNDSLIEANWISNKSKYRFKGIVSNRGSKITIYKQQIRWARDVEPEFTKESIGYAYLTPDGCQLVIMALKDNKHSFMRLTRKE
jgi:tetratricopeptide (TPR) repeat protein